MEKYWPSRSSFLLSLILAGLFSFLGGSCVPPRAEEIPSEVTFSYQDSLFQQISNWQDLAEEDSLYVWLAHKNPNFRYLAARAFASIQSEEALDKLQPLLRDPVDEVRAVAAFAIGQIGGEEALNMLIRGFMPRNMAAEFPLSQRNILEAVGKCGNLETLNNLSTAKNYEVTDTSEVEGQAWGIYRFGLNEIVSQDGIDRMLEISNNGEYTETARLVAANFLSRMDVSIDSMAAKQLTNTFRKEDNTNIRMALAIAIGKTRQEDALAGLLAEFSAEKDYRVKCNIIKALTNFPYENGRALMLEAIRDENEHVARRAVEYLLDKSSPADATLWWKFAKDSLSTMVKLDLYRVANRHLPVYLTDYRDGINAELRQQFLQASSNYEKAAALRALGEFAWNFRFIYRETQGATSPVLKSASLEVLKEISERSDFGQFFNASARRVKRELVTYFQQAIRGGDPGQIAIAAQALRAPDAGFNAIAADSVQVLKTALEALELPAMIESYNELAETIAYLEDGTFEAKTLPFNHPIDWKALDALNENQTIEIETNRGTIVLELWPNDAPGTVANFLNLMDKDFFNEKFFHRVVPNFVIQGGCPRGDGYGSLDYSIRSEFADRHYDREGILGMASAGKDTEGTQFFITHSPTLHLDGRYTAFGRVVEGMDIVHDILIGDKIKEINL